MKKVLHTAILISCVTAILVGCSPAELALKNGISNVSIGGEISGDDFLVIADKELTDSEKSFVDTAKQQPGLHRQGDLFVLSLGEKPTGGYGIEYVRTEVAFEEVKVFVRTKNPDPDAIVSQVLTYPHLTAKVKLPENMTITIMDEVTGKPLFSDSVK